MLDETDPVAELSVEECWELLAGERLGRLAYRLVDEVHVVPLNYAVDGRTILFRTHAGNKLLAAALETDVGFEIDWYDEVSAWSVLARGRLRRLEEWERHRVDDLGLVSWVPERRTEAIELDPDVVTGRRFHLSRPGPGREVPA